MKLAITVVLWILSAALGAFVGARWGLAQGPTQSVWVDAPARGVVLVGYLRQLRSGKTQSVIDQLEIELDGQIAWHDMYLREGKPYLLSRAARGFLESAPRYMKRVVAYRREYPSTISKHAMSPLGPDATDEEREFHAEIRQGGEELEAAIKRVMQLYGDDGKT
jgi:hypothetical protein